MKKLADTKKLLVELTRKWGGVYVTVSGEAKLCFDYKGAGGWLTHEAKLFSGDIGCVKPEDTYDKSALSCAFDWLATLNFLPFMNRSDKEHYVSQIEEVYRDALEDMELDIAKTEDKLNYRYEIPADFDKKDDYLLVIDIKLVPNEFVMGAYNKAIKSEEVYKITSVQINDDGDGNIEAIVETDVPSKGKILLTKDTLFFFDESYKSLAVGSFLINLGDDYLLTRGEVWRNDTNVDNPNPHI